MDWYLAVLKKYAVFGGRARRKEFWMFHLFDIIFLTVAFFLDIALAGTDYWTANTALFSTLYIVAILIPTLVVLVRRLHDVGKSDWYYFVGLILIVGPIIALVGRDYWPAGMSLFSTLYILALLIPGLAVMVRRLHDVGKSGWYYFVGLIPIVGPIWLLVLMCTEGDRGPNAYGLDPKQYGYENQVSSNINAAYSQKPQQNASSARLENSQAQDFKFCPQCGTRNNISSDFCNSCGFKMPSTDVNPARDESPMLQDQQNFEPEAIPKQYGYENPVSSNINAAYPQKSQQTDSPELLENAPATDFKLCPQCGNRNKIRSAFCNHCGFKMPSTDIDPSPDESPILQDQQKYEPEAITDISAKPSIPVEDIDATQLLKAPVVPILIIRSNGQEETAVIDKSEFVIGRSPDATDYTFKDNNNIGRTHAKIISQEGFYYIVDLDSKNGTYVNGTQVESGVHTPIQFGDTIKLANQDFVFDKS